MSNIKLLERRWLSYKSKIFLIPLIKFSFLYLFSAIAYFSYLSFNKDEIFLTNSGKTIVLGISKDSSLSSSKIENTVEVKEEPKLTIEEIQSRSKQVEVKENLKEELSLEPIIPIINMQKEEQKKVQHRTRHKKKSSSHLVKAKHAQALTVKELHVINARVSTPHKSKKVLFKSSSKNYIKKMKSKFAHSQQARDALLLAKVYYEKRDYKASEKWALTANKIDSSLDESWFIFAKSKSKLGQKEEAIKILTHYYSKNHSFKIKQMIHKLKRDKI